MSGPALSLGAWLPLLAAVLLARRLDHGAGRWLLAFPVALALGWGASSMIVWALMLLVPASRAALLYADTAVWLMACAYLLRSRAVVLRPPDPAAAGRRPRSSRLSLWLSIAIAAPIVVLAILRVAATAATLPHGMWDAWAFWNARARALFLGYPGDWQAASTAIPRPDYPLLTPLAISRVWQFLGHETVAVPIGMAAAFGMGAAVLAGASVARAYGAARGWLTAAAVLASPAYLTATISQFADVPLAFYMLATLVAFDRAISSDRAVWWMAAAGCAGCAAWTKNEGRVFLILSMAAMAFQAWRMAAPAAGRRIAALVLGVLPGIAALASFRMLLPAPHNLFTDLSIGHVMHDAGSGARWRAIAESLGRQIAFGGSTTIGNVPVVAAVTAALGRARPCPPAAVYGALVLVLMLLAYAVTYLLSPFDLAWHLRTSADRVVVQLVPAAIWALMMSGRRRPGVTAE
jgi:hypothetical protein